MLRLFGGDCANASANAWVQHCVEEMVSVGGAGGLRLGLHSPFAIDDPLIIISVTSFLAQCSVPLPHFSLRSVMSSHAELCFALCRAMLSCAALHCAGQLSVLPSSTLQVSNWPLSNQQPQPFLLFVLFLD